MTNDIAISRSGFEKLGKQYKEADGVDITKQTIRGVTTYWFNSSRQLDKNKIIIYLHGGCFVLGSIDSHKALVSHLAQAIKIPILFIDYSLAPENAFPEAINEIIQVYEQLSTDFSSHDFIFMGDSAGAALSMSVISTLNKGNRKAPSQLVMISPWIDLRNSSDSITDNAAIDPVLTKESLEKYTNLYIGKADLHQANPIETLFGTFPATLILAGSNEILLDDSKMAYSKISETQANARMKIYEGATHVWLLDDIQSEHSKNALNEIRSFIFED